MWTFFLLQLSLSVYQLFVPHNKLLFTYCSEEDECCLIFLYLKASIEIKNQLKDTTLDTFASRHAIVTEVAKIFVKPIIKPQIFLKK